MAEEGGGKKSTFRRLIKAVRYAVVSMVAVLIGAVIVNTVVLVLQPGFLSCSVFRGALLARRAPGHRFRSPAVTLDFELIFRNPSAGARTMYLVNTRVYIFDNNTSASTPRPARDCALRFRIPNQASTVAPNSAVRNYIEVTATNYSTRPYFFQELYYKGLNISGLTMRLDGIIINELWSAVNTTPRSMTYYCQPLVISFADRHDKDYKQMPDMPCVVAL